MTDQGRLLRDRTVGGAAVEAVRAGGFAARRPAAVGHVPLRELRKDARDEYQARYGDSDGAG